MYPVLSTRSPTRSGLLLPDAGLSPTAAACDNARDAERLADFIYDDARVIPIIAISSPQGDQPRWLDADRLARALLGMSYVTTLKSEASWTLTKRLGKRLSVFDGAVRVYLAGNVDQSDPYRHRFFQHEQIASYEGGSQVDRLIRWQVCSTSLRTIRLGSDIKGFAALRAETADLRTGNLKRAGALQTDLALISEKQIETLKEENKDLKKSNDHYLEEYFKIEERAEAAENQNRGLKFRLDALLRSRPASGLAEAPHPFDDAPRNWSELGDWCDRNLIPHLVLAPPARRNARGALFSDITLVVRCLRWLASECRQSRMSGNGGTDTNVIEEGIWNSHCGNDEFDFEHGGQRYTADWHIKTGGNTRDPVRCLRIYYTWDPTELQINVADLPAHRRTGGLLTPSRPVSCPDSVARPHFPLA